jgi:uncharacterized protein (TIGR02757 family)
MPRWSGRSAPRHRAGDGPDRRESEQALGPSCRSSTARRAPRLLERVSRKLLDLPARERLLSNDPVRFPRLYEDPGDREVAALVGAFLAFGSVKAFLPKLEALLSAMGRSPRDFVLGFGPPAARAFLDSFRLRVWTGDDLRLLFWNLRSILEDHGSLEDAFLSAPVADGPSRHRRRLEQLARLFYRVGPGGRRPPAELPRGYRHLVTDPARGSASKRWNLFLRWVVRPDDGVDLGLWTRVALSELVIPLDLHVFRITFLLGLRKRRTCDWKAAEEITENLKALDPEDPLKFDFPMSHLGISRGCRGRWVGDVCGDCPVADVCRAARRGGKVRK